MPASSSARSSSLPAGPTNGCPATSSSIARLLADEHDVGARRPFAEHRLGAASGTDRTPCTRPHSRTLASVGRSGSSVGTGSPGRRLGAPRFSISHRASRPPMRRARPRAAPHRWAPGDRRNAADSRRIAAVPERDREIAAQPLHACPLHRAALQQRSQLIVGSLPQVQETRPVEARTRLPGRSFGAGQGRQIPRADFLADVAAVDVRADGVALLRRESAPFSSIVRYERHRVESSTPGATSAPVGQASRHSVHVPH